MSSHGDFKSLDYLSDHMADKGIEVPGEKETENYFRVINYVDTCLKNFFKGIMSQGKPFIMVIYGDHTSGVKSDGYVPRTSIAEKVPLFIILDKEMVKRQIDTPGSQFDLPPTILSLAGVKWPLDWQGINLASEHRERLFLKNRRVSVDASGQLVAHDPEDQEWAETVYAVENHIK